MEIIARKYSDSRLCNLSWICRKSWKQILGLHKIKRNVSGSLGVQCYTHFIKEIFKICIYLNYGPLLLFKLKVSNLFLQHCLLILGLHQIQLCLLGIQLSLSRLKVPVSYV